MAKYYRAINGCKKCTRKGIFSLSEAEAFTWCCPYDATDCSSEIEASSWFLKNKSPLLKGSILAAIVLGVVSLCRDDDGDKLAHKLTETQKNVTTFSSQVRKVPQNPGLSDPYKQKWVSKYENRAKRLKSQIEPIREDLEKLSEYQQGIELESIKAQKMVVPEFTPTKPLKKYADLKTDGRKLKSQLDSVKRQANTLEENGIIARAKSSERKLKKDIQTLNSKSKALVGVGDTREPFEVKLSYIDELKNTQAAIASAIKLEKSRLAQLAADEEARRLKELEEDRLKSLQQKIDDWNAAQPNVSIKTSKALTASLIEPLVRAYLSQNGTEYTKLNSPHGEEVYRYTSPSFTIELSEGGSLAIDPLVVEVRDRATSKRNSRVIALDAMVAVGGASVPAHLVASDLEKILAGQITNWSQVGGSNGRINVVVPYAGSGDSAVLGDDIQALISKNSRALTKDNVSKFSSHDSHLLRLCSFHSSLGMRRIGVRASKSSPVFSPTPSSISSENYRYTKRVYIDMMDAPNDDIEKFLTFVESGDGQKIVSECGYIDLRIDLVSKPLDDFAIPIIAKAFNVQVSDIVSAYRLNTNFRFATNSANLDTKARADIERVQQTLNIHLGSKKKALVVGFADSDGSDESNEVLSSDRSKKVFGKLITNVRKRSDIKSVGEGEKHPIADNDSNIGKSQNRRVEVWIVEIN